MSVQMSAAILAKSEAISGFLIIFSFILAICIANIDVLSQSYKDFVFFPILFGYGQFTCQFSLISLVNDGLMTLFFLLIGLELKFHLVCGEYRDRKTLILPSVAALGGIIIPALIYMCFNFGMPSMKGWAIPIATDTAFMLGILSFFNKSISLKLRAFIISFSLIDDALALSVLAIFYKKSSNLTAIMISLILFSLLIALRVCKVRNSIYYLLVGIFLWIAMVGAGIHGTLCGALIALIIPVEIDGKVNSSFYALESIVKPIVYFFILPLFVFINAGINFDSLSIEVLTSNITIGVILGLFLGKQLGILCFSYGAVKMKWCVLPYNVSWKQFYAIAVLGGIGFTLSLFIGDFTFEANEPNYAMRTGVIIGSLLSVLTGIIILACLAKKGSDQK